MENETKNIFKNRTIWLRADFHLHTKADKEFSYLNNENDLSVRLIAEIEARRKQYEYYRGRLLDFKLLTH
ncbi:MAG: hypothetical protein A2X02_00575 [Bacteroidetes bacterium GWF2_29_10]|nr:MAG: hypothetical protein A2X02_00575 [Bacteroidetes bacterium GWF2_29_10]